MEKQLPQSMQNLIKQVEEKLGDDQQLIQMFKNCYTNTLDTTVKKMDDGTTYVITGDIPAMWLRDSVCQLRPYYVLAQEDPEITKLIEGLVRRQMMYILLNPYANAFNEADNGNCWEQDETDIGKQNTKLIHYVSRYKWRIYYGKILEQLLTLMRHSKKQLIKFLKFGVQSKIMKINRLIALLEKIATTQIHYHVMVKGH